MTTQEDITTSINVQGVLYPAMEYTSEEIGVASYMLSQEIQAAINTKDDSLIQSIRILWDNESWDSIVEKFNTEGSTWIVWWQDGIRSYMGTPKFREG